jgi:hypothetical protein
VTILQILLSAELQLKTEVIIASNTISVVRLTTKSCIIQYAILLSGTHTNGVISENKITKMARIGIIRTLSLEVTRILPPNILVANSFISDITTTEQLQNGASGIQYNLVNMMYHNSVVLNGNQKNNISVCSIECNAGTELDIINNIFWKHKYYWNPCRLFKCFCFIIFEY